MVQMTRVCCESVSGNVYCVPCLDNEKSVLKALSTLREIVGNKEYELEVNNESKGK